MKRIWEKQIILLLNTTFSGYYATASQLLKAQDSRLQTTITLCEIDAQTYRPLLSPHLCRSQCYRQLVLSHASSCLPRWHQRSTAVLVVNPPDHHDACLLYPAHSIRKHEFMPTLHVCKRHNSQTILIRWRFRHIRVVYIWFVNVYSLLHSNTLQQWQEKHTNQEEHK